MRELPHTAAEDLLELVMRRYDRFDPADVEPAVEESSRPQAQPAAVAPGQPL